MNYHYKLLEGVVILSIDDNEFFSTSSEEVMETLKSEIEKENTAFIIDLQKVNYLNSSGINILIAILTAIRNKEGELVLVSISEKIKSVLIITKLNSIFNVKSSMTEAIEFLNVHTKIDSIK